MKQKISFSRTPSGLSVVKVANDLGSLEFTTYGAHILGYCPRSGEPVLWLSKHSPMQSPKAIRGGIPVCFPWFGNMDGHPDWQIHGVARIKEWDLQSIEATDKGSVIKLHTTQTENTLMQFPYAFDLVYTITLSESLGASLKITNTDTKPFTYEAALHSYFSVKALSAGFSSLEGVAGLDKTDGYRPFAGSKDTRITESHEVSGFYLQAPSSNTIYDNAKSRAITIDQEGFEGITIWNPSKALGLKNPEIQEGWSDFVCLESTLCLDRRRTLEPGASQDLSIRITEH
ncbi:MAG: hypothetical protein PHI83_04015 [Sphaerochaetaceae bacterium]|jgi:glucose-6-phosphate 1-epimerase|nr:hypothetical protein [Sphaerochaetaceae bacterium]